MINKTKKTVIVGLIMSAALAPVAFFSCKKTNPEVVQTSSETRSNPSLSILEKNYNPLVYFLPYKEDPSKLSARQNNSTIIYSSGKVLIEGQKIQEIYNDLQSNFGSNLSSAISPKAIVLYADCPYTTIAASNITGISIISFNQNKLEHRFYEIKNNGLANEVDKFQCQFNSYDSNDFSLLLDEVTKQNATYASFLFLTSPEFKAFKAVGQPQVYLTRNLIDNGIMNKPIYGGEKNLCEECNDKSETESCATDENGDVYCTGGCQNKILINVGVKYNKVADIDLKQAYNFRDNFLNKYSKGRDYIDYYYKVSYIVGGLSLININTFDQTLELTKKLYAIADRMQNGADNEIIINNDLKNYLDAAIEDYKTKSDNNEFKQIMNKIKSDLNQFKNKTRSHIISKLQ